MIKVLASNPKQAVEITEAFKNSSADVVIEVKENTATENSDDIKCIAYFLKKDFIERVECRDSKMSLDEKIRLETLDIIINR